MTLTSLQIGLSRRVLASYLLSCTLVIACMLFGGLYATHAVVDSQATTAALSRTDRVVSAVELDQLVRKGEGVQEILQAERDKGGLAYLAVVSPTGVFTAHTDGAYLGQPAPERVGDRLAWGQVTGVSYRESDRCYHEYRAPLSVHGAGSGELVLGMIDPGWRAVAFELVHYGWLVVVGPLLVTLLGAVVLARMTTPVACLEKQLERVARLPHGAAPRAEHVGAGSLLAIGWNRLVSHLEQTEELLEHATRETPRDESLGGAHESTLDALNSLSDGIVVTDAQGRIEFANRAVAALLGCDDPLEGEDWSLALEALCPERANELARSVGAGSVEEVSIGAQERPVTLRLAKAPLRSDSQEGNVWTLRDVTQQKLANASRDQFIDTATHELRTPLANIKAYAETLASCDIGDAEQQKEFCNTINAEATRLARFVDDLLSISSIEVGTLGVTRQNVDLRRLCEESAEKVKPLMTSKSLDFQVMLGEKLGEASLDKDKVCGLLVNLLGNAAKYTPSGGSVTFTAAREASALVFEVNDTGAGIDEEEQERVFEKFFRSANPAVQESVGTGLGLPLARDIARLHDGDITLTSALGEGSTFTVTLPI